MHRIFLSLLIVLSLCSPSYAVLNDGLQLVLDFEDTGNFGDDTSTNNYDMTTSGTITSVTGKTGAGTKGVNFNTSTGHLSITHASIPNLNFTTNSFTLAYWANIGNTSNGFIVDKRAGTANGYESDMSAAEEFRMELDSGTQNTYGPTTAKTGAGWTSVVIVFDKSTSPDEVRFYFNASLDTTEGSDRGDISTTQDLFIGSNTASSSNFPLDVDQIALWDKALDTTEISALYNGGSGTLLPQSSSTFKPQIIISWLTKWFKPLHILGYS